MKLVKNLICAAILSSVAFGSVTTVALAAPTNITAPNQATTQN
jgi:hypothetical protein